MQTKCFLYVEGSILSWWKGEVDGALDPWSSLIFNCLKLLILNSVSVEFDSDIQGVVIYAGEFSVILIGLTCTNSLILASKVSLGQPIISMSQVSFW